MIFSGCQTFDVAHSVGRVTLRNDHLDNTFDGKWIGFVGDRTFVTLLDGTDVPQDPPAITLDLDQHHARRRDVKAATQKSVAQQTREVDTSESAPFFTSKGGMTCTLPWCVRIPWAWALYFLEEERDPEEAFRWIIDKTNAWDRKDKLRTFARSWFQAAATVHTTDDNGSMHQLPTPMAMPTANVEASRWATRLLHSRIPIVKQTPSPPPLAPATTSAICSCANVHKPKCLWHALFKWASLDRNSGNN